MSQFLLISLSIVIGIMLGVLSNWIYDLLREKGLFPSNPTPKRVVIVALSCLPLVVAVSAIEIGLSNVPQGLPIVSASVATSSGPPPIVEQTAPVPTQIPLSLDDEIKRDDFSSASTGWNNYIKDNVATGYDSGRYFIELNDYLLFLSIWRSADKFDNGVLQVDVLSLSDNEGNTSQGLGFGWRNNWEGSTYAFTINSTGVCKFFEAVGGSGGWIVQRSDQIAGFDKTRSYHTLKVYVRGNEATGYVDESFCVQYIMPNYERGYVGVVALPSSSTLGQKLYFDEYRIFRIP